jgi:hypothetical protein
MNGHKSVLLTVSNSYLYVNENREKLVHFQQPRELHASACDIAETANAV